MGPTGVGALYIKKKLMNEMVPFLMGGQMIKEVSMESSNWADPPFKFEAGTPNISQIIGLGAAIKYFTKINNSDFHKYLDYLKKYLLDELSEIPKIKLYQKSKKNGPIIAFNIKGIHAYDIAKLLDTFGICIRAGHHCAQPILNKYKQTSINRISLYFYNTKEEIDRFYDSLLKVIKILS